jgi:hypothetical protein
MAKEKFCGIDSEVKEDGSRVFYKNDGSVYFTVDKDNNFEMTVPVVDKVYDDLSRYSADLSTLKKEGTIKTKTIRGKFHPTDWGKRGYVDCSGYKTITGQDVEHININEVFGVEMTTSFGDMVYKQDGSLRIGFGDMMDDKSATFYPNGKLHSVSENQICTIYRTDGTRDYVHGDYWRGEDVWSINFDKTGEKPVSYEFIEPDGTDKKLTDKEMLVKKSLLRHKMLSAASKAKDKDIHDGKLLPLWYNKALYSFNDKADKAKKVQKSRAKSAPQKSNQR